MNLQKILEDHKKYIESNGEKGEKANLSGANLSGADLRGANLREAHLFRVNLFRTNLRGAYLGRADLSRANLRGADLRGADLSEASLSKANLRGADLRNCNKFLTARIDPRGWELKIWKQENPASLFQPAFEIWVSSGCHTFPLDKALAHWGSEKYPNKERGQKYVDTINFLVGMLK